MRRLLRWLRSLVLRRRLEREMQEEMRQHLERATERLMARGLSSEEARNAALREFGNVPYLQEQARDARGGRWIGTLTPDAKLALRMLVKNPLLSIVGGLGMAVTIAIATGFFTFMTFYYSDPPVEDGDRVITVEYIDGEFSRSTLFDYQVWKTDLTSVQDLAAYREDRRQFESFVDGPLTTRGAEMTASGFRVARVPPLLGRPLLDSDEITGAPPVVVIGHREWLASFGGDPDIIGAEARLGGIMHTIVGVMPEGFRLPANHGLWTPLSSGTTPAAAAGGSQVHVFGRLEPGIARAAAEAEAATIGERLTARYPQIYQKGRPAVLPYIRHLLDVQWYPAWLIWLMQLFAGLILTVVAVNVAVLVYARTAIRRAEITIRTALGASRSRIVTQLFLEALALSAVAAVLGLLIARIGFRQLTGLEEVQAFLPYWLFGSLPARTILYAAGLAVLAAIVVGVLPALQATGRHLQTTLRQLGGGTGLQLGRTWTALICVQVAVAVGILPAVVGVAWNYTPPPTPTFSASEIVSFTLRRPTNASSTVDRNPQPADTTYGILQAELFRRVEAIPGVTGVTFASRVPVRWQGVRVQVADPPGTVEPNPCCAGSYQVALGYFDAFDVPLLAGRRFDRGDVGPGTTAAIVNRSFADKYLAGGEALGHRFRESQSGTELSGAEPWFEVVGVVEDMLRPSQGRLWPATYHPIGLGTEPLSLAARAAGVDPANIASRIRGIARDLAPANELVVSTLDGFYSTDGGQLRLLLALMAGLITLSVLLLSAGGISAMMSFAVTRRKREIGIRTALGASHGHLVASIFSRAVRQLGAGVVIGAAAAAVLDRLTGGAMLDGEVFTLLALVAAVMILSGLLATLGPARRALRTHPMEALREE